MNIEDHVTQSDILPCNTLAMVNRIRELLAEYDTNTMLEIPDNDIRIDKVIYLLVTQRYGQLHDYRCTHVWQWLNSKDKQMEGC